MQGERCLQCVRAGYSNGAATDVHWQRYCRSAVVSCEDIRVLNALHFDLVRSGCLSGQRVAIYLWELAALEAGTVIGSAGIQMILDDGDRAATIHIALEPEVSRVNFYQARRRVQVVHEWILGKERLVDVTRAWIPRLTQIPRHLIHEFTRFLEHV